MSEIGEQWSPYTEPARVAPRAGTRYIAVLSAEHIMVMIGISIPKVPQDVPMEKLIMAAIINISIGSRLSGRLVEFTKPEMNIPVPISWRQTPPRLQERIRISIGGTMLPMPPTMLPMNSFAFIGGGECTGERRQ